MSIPDGTTFTKAFGDLDQICKDLEKGNIDIDDVIKKVEEATELYSFCQGKLKNAEERIDKALQKINVETKPEGTKSKDDDLPF